MCYQALAQTGSLSQVSLSFTVQRNKRGPNRYIGLKVLSVRKSLSLSLPRSLILSLGLCTVYFGTLGSRDMWTVVATVAAVSWLAASCCSYCVRTGAKDKLLSSPSTIHCISLTLSLMSYYCYWSPLTSLYPGQWDTEHRCTVLRASYSTVQWPVAVTCSAGW